MQKSEMEHALMLKQKEIETRLEATEEGHRQSQNGTRQLLTAQQKATAKYLSLRFIKYYIRSMKFICLYVCFIFQYILLLIKN